MLFQRTKPLDLILETASKRSLTRQLGAFELTMLGIGAVIGTGIFVLTAVAANKAGPGMMYSLLSMAPARSRALRSRHWLSSYSCSCPR